MVLKNIQLFFLPCQKETYFYQLVILFMTFLRYFKNVLI